MGRCMNILKIVGVVFIVMFSVHIGMSMVKLDPPGELIGYGHYGQHLHLYCIEGLSSSQQTDKNNETLVVFESGISRTGADFVAIQDSLAIRGISSCSFDRPGQGFSSADESDSPPSRKISQFVVELHAALEGSSFVQQFLKHKQEGEETMKDFLVVGHSMGGITARWFGNKYPDRVHGVVSIDSTPESDPIELEETLSTAIIVSRYVVGPVYFLGLPRYLSWLGMELPPLPGRFEYTAREFSLRYSTMSTSVQELENLVESAKEYLLMEKKQIPTAFLVSSDDHSPAVLTSSIKAAKTYNNTEGSGKTSFTTLPDTVEYKNQYAYVQQLQRTTHFDILASTEEIVYTIMEVLNFTS